MKMREGRMKCYGHVMRRDQEHVRRGVFGNGVTAKEEKRKAEEKTYGSTEKEFGGTWCEEEGL